MLSAGVLVVLTALSGLGLGWVKNLATPGTVRSWAAPATAVGMASTGIAHGVGWMVDQASILSVTRSIGLLLAIAAGVWLLKESDRIGQLTALGLTLLLFACCRDHICFRRLCQLLILKFNLLLNQHRPLLLQPFDHQRPSSRSSPWSC